MKVGIWDREAYVVDGVLKLGKAVCHVGVRVSAECTRSQSSRCSWE